MQIATRVLRPYADALEITGQPIGAGVQGIVGARLPSRRRAVAAGVRAAWASTNSWRRGELSLGVVPAHAHHHPLGVCQRRQVNHAPLRVSDQAYEQGAPMDEYSRRGVVVDGSMSVGQAQEEARASVGQADERVVASLEQPELPSLPVAAQGLQCFAEGVILDDKDLERDAFRGRLLRPYIAQRGVLMRANRGRGAGRSPQDSAGG